MDAEIPASLPDEHAYPFVSEIPPDIIKIGPILRGLKRHRQKISIRFSVRFGGAAALLIAAVGLGHGIGIFSPGTPETSPSDCRTGRLRERTVTRDAAAGKRELRQRPFGFSVWMVQLTSSGL